MSQAGGKFIPDVEQRLFELEGLLNGFCLCLGGALGGAVSFFDVWPLFLLSISSSCLCSSPTMSFM